MMIGVIGIVSIIICVIAIVTIVTISMSIVNRPPPRYARNDELGIPFAVIWYNIA